MTARPGTLLQDLSWNEAQLLLKPDTIVVVPLGSAAKEHGPHLKLNNDWIIAEYLKEKILDNATVVVAPTVPFSYYPSFVDYPGSISLSLETASNLLVEICTSLAKFGPRRFYVINTGISTGKPLNLAAAQLASQGIRLTFTNFADAISAAAAAISEQEGGSHADEIETSIMLHIAPHSVDMSKAVKDFHANNDGPLSRQKTDGCSHSPSGIWGDATLATVEKGRTVVKSLLASILADIAKLNQTAVPSSKTEKSQ